MRIIAITRALNEADIIECFVRHTSAFVAHHVIMDDGSADSTIDILIALKREGVPLTVYQSKSISYNESDTLSLLYKEACRRHAPDWVLCVDADEFIDDRQLADGLHKYLQQLLDSKWAGDFLSVPMVNYAATARDNPDEVITPVRMRQRLGHPGARKIILRGNLGAEDICIDNGSERASLKHRPVTYLQEPRLCIAHYSERSPYQYIVKFVRGWSKVLATGQAAVDRHTAYHYRAPYEMLRDRPKDLLRSTRFMGFKNESANLIEDPIDYRGGPLKYTPRTDEAMRAVQCLMGFLDDISLRHGKVLDHFPEVRKTLREWETEFEIIV